MQEPSNGEIMVSIICNAYNQEKYIADALEGFVSQKTDFAFEILVHDDASTDKTAQIIRKYEKRYPDLIRPIYETENQYSKHDGSLERIQIGRIKGKYTAMCEGDDYWTDPLKLQKQFDAMEGNPQADMCAHKAQMINAKTSCKIKSFPAINENRILTVEEVIYGKGDFVSTNSLFYRSTLHAAAPRFKAFWDIDWTLQIYGALRGGILFLEDEMSVYRYMTSGSWTERNVGQADRKLEIYNKKQRMLDLLNEDTNGQYAQVIEKRKRKNEWEMLGLTGRHKERLNKKYREFIKELSIGGRMRQYMKAWFPWVLTLRRKITKSM